MTMKNKVELHKKHDYNLKKTPIHSTGGIQTLKNEALRIKTIAT